MISEKNERLKETQYQYNEWNRLSLVTRADGSTMTVNDSGSSSVGNNYTGGNVGQLKKYGSEAGQYNDGIKDAKLVETKFVKDIKSYVSRVQDAQGNETKIIRDAKGKPTEIKRPDGTTATFVYDAATDDLLSQTDTATNISSSQTFDEFGAQLTATNGRGQTSTKTKLYLCIHAQAKQKRIKKS
jgi:YD repeat-containing protein